jgi:hypothetical protein
MRRLAWTRRAASSLAVRSTMEFRLENAELLGHNRVEGLEFRRGSLRHAASR